MCDFYILMCAPSHFHRGSHVLDGVNNRFIRKNFAWKIAAMHGMSSQDKPVLDWLAEDRSNCRWALVAQLRLNLLKGDWPRFAILLVPFEDKADCACLFCLAANRFDFAHIFERLFLRKDFDREVQAVKNIYQSLRDRGKLQQLKIP